MTHSFIDALKQRRTRYALGRGVSQDRATIEALVKDAMRHTPSSFNSQSSRALILFGAQSERFWTLVEEALRPIAPKDGFDRTVAKLAGFAAGVGTVLFFEDQDVVKGLQDKFAAYADNFPVWSEHGSGIAQFAVWTALADAGIGASLQHYNPLPDAAAAAEWNVPASWKLRAMMPFGSNEGGFGEKTFMDDAERFRVFG